MSAIFKELLEYCRLQAISDVLSPTVESVYRDACRNYSKTFHTELEKVFQLDPEKVLRANYEEQLQDIDIEENIEVLLEEVYRIENPDYDRDKETDLQDYIKNIQKEEYEKAQSKKTLPEKENPIPPNMPTGGSINASLFNSKNEG
jgi:hypothetical protein